MMEQSQVKRKLLFYASVLLGSTQIIVKNLDTGM